MKNFDLKELEDYLEEGRLDMRRQGDVEWERMFERWLEAIRKSCSFNEQHESPSATTVSHAPLRAR